MKSKKQLIKQALIILGLMVGAVTLLSLVPAAHAQFLTPSDQPSTIAEATGGEGSLRSLVLRIVNYFLGFLGILAVIMIIYGGVTYVTAAGSDEAIGNAKKIIMYALIGLIIILLSFAIVNTILGAGTGVAT
ncbi:MAG: MMCAP2_0565 family pilin-like conjugal transfer protein [Candidatus Peregrinibacteria bacterium]